jgi:hypothetical protein
MFEIECFLVIGRSVACSIHYTRKGLLQRLFNSGYEKHRYKKWNRAVRTVLLAVKFNNRCNKIDLL